MKQISWELEAHKGYCVIQCVYNQEDEPIDEEMIRYMGEAHNKKIDLCDAIYVVDIDGYIGSAVKNEIIYAQGHARNYFTQQAIIRQQQIISE